VEVGVDVAADVEVVVTGGGARYWLYTSCPVWMPVKG
jgi:hypothetical protein